MVRGESGEKDNAETPSTQLDESGQGLGPAPPASRVAFRADMGRRTRTLELL